MARLTHSETSEKIQALTARYIAGEFPFTDDVLRASFYAIGLRGDELREAFRSAAEQKEETKWRPKHSRRPSCS